ncbi:helix-turn-helix domain-containing protein [Haladaptatus sp. DYF46]|uniref:winged helix-turn-helix domain-containing protein n=1 Tax=Haladaptatus sp. DYF46 TaxID=2886041 RepID=UPI001E482901|nr:helix-turn-helix domain-containing protein [Haladaptatus sp. DYF46]
MKQTTNQNTRKSATLDRIFDVFSHQSRRRILSKLATDSPRDEGEFEGKNEELERSLISNTHVHLPKLADGGFIEWNREEGTVAHGPRFEEILPLLETIENHEN